MSTVLRMSSLFVRTLREMRSVANAVIGPESHQLEGCKGFHPHQAAGFAEDAQSIEQSLGIGRLAARETRPRE